MKTFIELSLTECSVKYNIPNAKNINTTMKIQHCIKL